MHGTINVKNSERKKVLISLVEMETNQAPTTSNRVLNKELSSNPKQ